MAPPADVDGDSGCDAETGNPRPSAVASAKQSRNPATSTTAVEVQTSLRPDAPASHTTIVGFVPCSVSIFTSIEANPKIELAINMQVARALKLTIAPGVAQRANRLIP